MHIKISDEIKAVCQNISLGVLTADVKVVESTEAVKAILNGEVVRIQNNFSLKNYGNEALESARTTYRKLGKDPTRYRISSDALVRRIMKQKGIYYVNNIVDLNNIISLKTLASVGVYDLNHISGQVSYDLGKKEAVYEGIGRGLINIENLPVLSDDNGPFGSATSDSLRTMITAKTERIMIVIHAFSGKEEVEKSLFEMKALLVRFAEAKDVAIKII